MRAENNDEDLISIIVPVYNVEKYLEQCLESLLNQTYKNIEIIVVNDGSTDQSLDILKKYSFKDNRIKLYSQKNQGISAARNTALEHINLYILGTGPLQSEMENYIRNYELQDAVTMLGYQMNPYKYVAKCDLFVCASFAEGFSTATTEALIVGVPVCTVEVSGMREMLGENNEWGVVTKNEYEALYQSIKQLLDEPGLLQHYKKQAEIRGKDFSTVKTVQAVEKLLFRLCGE